MLSPTQGQFHQISPNQKVKNFYQANSMMAILEQIKQNLRRRKKIIALCLLLIMEEIQQDKKQRLWVKPWIMQRKEQRIYHNLFLELTLEDPNKFLRCLRMDTATFEDLLHKVTSLIIKQDTHLRKSISSAERLSMTLKHLATGETQESLSMYF